jgi:hypothetical protein
MDTVYDTEVIAKANGDLEGRRRGNKMDVRLSRIEEFLSGSRRAFYNQKLLGEYSMHVKECRNDVIAAFVQRLADHGVRVKRSKLSSGEFAAALSFKWPAHDQHLLAAALEGERATVFVVEDKLAACARGARREFEVVVCQL